MVTLRETTRSPGRSWRQIVGLLAAVALALGLYSTHRDHFRHHNDRLLTEMASSSSIHVQFTTKNTSTNNDNDAGGLIITGLLYPRSTGADLEFDGRLSYQFLGQEFNFTLLNNRGYVTVEDLATHAVVSNDCLKRVNIPPIHLLMDALREARVVDDGTAVGVETASCTDGKLVEFAFADEFFVFCSRSNGAIDKIHGTDIDATVQLLRDNTATAPKIDELRRPGDQSVDSCELLTGESEEETTLEISIEVGTVRAAGRALKRLATHAPDVVKVMTGQPRTLQSMDEDCSTACKGGKKICLFVHGLGFDLDAPLADSYGKAWGDPSQFKCCTQTKFLRMDTVNNVWYGDVLSKKFCDATVSLTDSDDPMELEGLAVISHSMGNLIVANAAAKKRCAVGGSSKWIALAGPMSGSKSANLVVTTCPKTGNSKTDNVVVQALTAINVCPSYPAMASMVYEHSDLSTDEINARYVEAEAAFTRLVGASLCGVSSTGLMSAKSAYYVTTGIASKHSSDHDGLVEIDSCRGSFALDRYQTSWRGGNLYRAAVNHGDSAFRNGDGLWGDARKPAKWLNCQF